MVSQKPSMAKAKRGGTPVKEKLAHRKLGGKSTANYTPSPGYYAAGVEDNNNADQGPPEMSMVAVNVNAEDHDMDDDHLDADDHDSDEDFIGNESPDDEEFADFAGVHAHAPSPGMLQSPASAPTQYGKSPSGLNASAKPKKPKHKTVTPYKPKEPRIPVPPGPRTDLHNRTQFTPYWPELSDKDMHQHRMLMSQQPHIPNEKNGRFEGRQLIRWTPQVDQLLLLCIHYEITKSGMDFPWDKVAARLASEKNATGQSILQHLCKLRLATRARGAWVPPLTGRVKTNVKDPYNLRGEVIYGDEPNEWRYVDWTEDASVLVDANEIDTNKRLGLGAGACKHPSIHNTSYINLQKKGSLNKHLKEAVERNEISNTGYTAQSDSFINKARALYSSRSRKLKNSDSNDREGHDGEERDEVDPAELPSDEEFQPTPMRSTRSTRAGGKKARPKYDELDGSDGELEVKQEPNELVPKSGSKKKNGIIGTSGRITKSGNASGRKITPGAKINGKKSVKQSTGGRASNFKAAGGNRSRGFSQSDTAHYENAQEHLSSNDSSQHYGGPGNFDDGHQAGGPGYGQMMGPNGFQNNPNFGKTNLSAGFQSMSMDRDGQAAMLGGLVQALTYDQDFKQTVLDLLQPNPQQSQVTLADDSIIHAHARLDPDSHEISQDLSQTFIEDQSQQTSQYSDQNIYHGLSNEYTPNTSQYSDENAGHIFDGGYEGLYDHYEEGGYEDYEQYDEYEEDNSGTPYNSQLLKDPNGGSSRMGDGGDNVFN